MKRVRLGGGIYEFSDSFTIADWVRHHYNFASISWTDTPWKEDMEGDNSCWSLGTIADVTPTTFPGSILPPKSASLRLLWTAVREKCGWIPTR